MRGKPPSVGRYSIQPIDTLVEPHPHRWSSGIRTWPLPTDTKERETLPLLRDSMDSGGTPEIGSGPITTDWWYTYPSEK